MGSVSRLTATTDVQAVTAAQRALLEQVIDLALLRFDETGAYTYEHVFAWERSAVLQQFEKIAGYYKKKPLPDAYKDVPTFLAGAEPAKIRANRLRLWGTEKHPGGRWTGRSRDLGADALKAQALLTKAGLTGADVHEFYELEYSPSCWGTHGSGLAGFRSSDVNAIPAQTALRLHQVADFALSVAQLVMEELGLFLQVEFDDFRRAGDHELSSIV
jgi:hypothetical protein